MEREPRSQTMSARTPDPFSGKGISKPAVQLFSFGTVVQRSKFLAEKTGKAEGKYTRKDVLEYLFREPDPDNQMRAILDWNKENTSYTRRIDPDIIIPTDEAHDPEIDYMPPMWGKSTEEAWSETVFIPGPKKKPAFYASKEGTAARMELKDIEEGRGRDRLDNRGQQQFACNACLKPTANESLQTDHTQPASDILDRQKKIIARMNRDRDYREAVMKYLPDAENYFIGDAPDIDGSKLFFSRFYNHMENLWFLCATCNGLTGKSSDDLLYWLGGLDWFGEEFIKSLGKVNTRGILMRAQDGKTVAQKAVDWAVEHGREELGEHSALKEADEKISEGLREVTILAIRAVHADSEAERKDAKKEEAIKRPIMKYRVEVVKKAGRASLGTSQAMLHGHDQRQKEKHPAYREGKDNPGIPNSYMPGTPKKSYEHFALGQKEAKEEEAIAQYPKVLEEKKQLILELSQKEKENAALSDEVERLKQELALLKPPSQAVTTTTTTVGRKANMKKEELENILEITDKLPKYAKHKKYRQYFKEKIEDKDAWSKMTKTDRNAIIAGVLLSLKIIKKPEDIGIYANAATKALAFDDVEAYIIK
ncbi:hypothetical protein [Chitinophaga sp.]|uniref:hypothetical protein n=1 Tax=Chitinophaga sp. TaxID=1869181 RepID=UPI0031DFDCFC